jgi:hypothetical protein
MQLMLVVITLVALIGINMESKKYGISKMGRGWQRNIASNSSSTTYGCRGIHPIIGSHPPR